MVADRRRRLTPPVAGRGNLQLPSEGSVLEGGEEGVHLGEGGAMGGLQRLNGVEAARERPLNVDWRYRQREPFNVLLIDARLVDGVFCATENLGLRVGRLKECDHERGLDA